MLWKFTIFDHFFPSPQSSFPTPVPTIPNDEVSVINAIGNLQFNLSTLPDSNNVNTKTESDDILYEKLEDADIVL